VKKRKTVLLAALVLAVAASTQAQDIVDAVTRGDLVRVKELVEKNPELTKARTPRSATLLHVAARLDNEAIAAYLIERGADVNAVQDDTRTPLLEAGIKVTRVLVEHGANVDYTTRDGFSAISLALHAGDEEVFDYLLDRKAKLVLPPPGTYRRLVAIERAMRMANPRVFEIFCEQGLDKSFENEARMTLAHFAAERGSAELIQKLVSYGAPVDHADVFGWTPLHTAAYAGNQAAVEALLGRGSNKNARTVDGKTPYVLAQEAKKTAVADYLAAQGADTSGPRPPALSGPYFGQKPPGTTPVPFVPGIPDIQEWRHGIFSFTPDGKEVYWKPRWSPSTSISHAQLKNGRWACATPSFSAENQGDDAPFVSPDGSRLFFLSQRPVVDGKLTFPYVEKIWMMTRTANGWSEPQKLPDEVNKVAGAHWQLSVDATNNLYFGARGGVHFARFAEGRYIAAERLGPAVNDGKTASFSPFIARDGSYLIFSRSHPVYTYQLFISFRRPDGAWNEAINLSEALNHPYSLNGRVTPDGKYLFFTGRNGVDYWVDASVIEALRPKAPREGRP